MSRRYFSVAEVERLIPTLERIFVHVLQLRAALRQQEQALERAGAGHGQVVALVGEAGVGKSRMVYELIHAHPTQGWRVLESASVSYGTATPYFPLIDLLPYGRQEEWQDSPEGWPQSPTYSRWAGAEAFAQYAEPG